jgi:hypothetical protein
MPLDTAEPGITITLSIFNSDQNNAHPRANVDQSYVGTHWAVSPLSSAGRAASATSGQS